MGRNVLVFFVLLVVYTTSTAGEEACGGSLNSTNGTIQSPGHPGNYVNHLHCVWTITVRPKQRIYLVFDSLKLELHSSCRYDYVKVQDGQGDSAVDLGTWCGTDVPPQLMSTNNTLTVTFHTDYSRVYSGFSAKWSTEKGNSVNLARGRPAYQASTYLSGTAGRAVDGNRNGDYNRGSSCSHTDIYANAWWYVDLGTAYSIDRVVLFNREDCCSDRLSPFRVHVGNSKVPVLNPSCGGNMNAPNLTVECAGLTGRYVGVVLPGNRRVLTLCEVEVYEGCPISDYVRFNGVCFQRFSDAKTYDQARQRCAADGGLLAIPKDSATNAFLASLGKGWIGLTDAQTEGQWVYADGQLPSYTNWNGGEPNNAGGNEDCAVIRNSGGTWNDLRCSHERAFFCQIDQADRSAEATTAILGAVPPSTTLPVFMSSESTKGCPISDYVRFNGTCFQHFSDGKTYDKARQRCAADGGLLAMPKDSATNAFLSSLGKGYIGLTDVQTEGQWVYVDGQVPGYTNWHAGEPNNYGGNEDCAVMYANSEGTWNDVPCSIASAFFCQIDQVEYSLTFRTSDDNKHSGSRDSLAVEFFSDVCNYCANTTVSGLDAMGTEYTRTLSASNFGVLKKLRLTTSGDDWLSLVWITVYNEFTRQLYRFSCPANGCGLSTDSSEGSRQIVLDVDAEATTAILGAVPPSTTLPVLPSSKSNTTTASPTEAAATGQTPVLTPHGTRSRISAGTAASDPVSETVLTLVIPISWNDDYDDVNSEAYKTLERELVSTLGNVYRNSSGFIGVRVDDFKPGSVQSVFSVLFTANSSLTAEEVTAPLVTAIEQSAITIAGSSINRLWLGSESVGNSSLCDVTVCADHAFCLEINANPRCMCPPGYQGNGSIECTDIDECTTKVHNCSRDELCFNTAGSFSCASCYPDITLIGGGNSPWFAPVIQRRSSFLMQSTVSVDCGEDFTLSYNWALFSLQSNRLFPLPLPSDVVTRTSELTIPNNTLTYGTVVVGLEVAVLETESGLRVPVLTAQWLTVTASPLVAHIVGGAARSVVRGSSVVVDASTSYDPDDVVTNSTLLTYSWSCAKASGVSCDEVFGGNTAQQSYVISASLIPSDVPEVTLTVQVGYTGRDPGSYSQLLQILPARSPLVAHIAGGSTRTVVRGSDVLVDASASHDPEGAVANSTLLNFSWSCITESGVSCDEVFENNTAQQSYVISASLIPSDVAEVTLMVEVGYTGRDPGRYNQTLQIIPTTTTATATTTTITTTTTTTTTTTAAAATTTTTTATTTTIPARSPLVAQIAGGSARSVDRGSDVFVDASASYDPDGDVTNSTLLTYSWSCTTETGASCDEVFGNSTGQQSYVISAALIPSNVTEVTLTVHVGYQERDPGWYNQTLQILPDQTPTVQIICLGNCQSKLNPSERLVLSSEYSCLSCKGDEPVRYIWTLQAAPANFGRADLDWDTETTTGRHLPDVVVQAGVFTAIGEYTLRLKVSLGPDITVFTQQTFQLNEPPAAGNCSVSPETGTAMVTEFNISCTGFSDSDLPLTYTFLYSTGAERLASVSTATAGVFSILHSGTVHVPARAFDDMSVRLDQVEDGQTCRRKLVQDSEAKTLLLPIGLESRDYNVTIRVDVSDALGATTSVQTVVKVFGLPAEQSADVAAQLVVGENSTLGNLVRRGDFLSVVQLSNSVTSVLNSVSNATGRDTTGVTTEVRDAVVSALSGVQTTSVTSVNLVASALGQATTVTEEVSTDSQVAAADTLKDMATFLQSVPAEKLGASRMEESAKFMMTAVINVLEGSVTTAERVKRQNDSAEQLQKTENATRAILDTVDVLNELVLTRKRPNESPTVIVQGPFELALQKQNCRDMGGQIVRTSDDSGTWFRIPEASVLFGNSCPDSVGFENYQTTLNPFAYASNSDDVKTMVASLQFRGDVGTLEVSDLQKAIDVVTPRKEGSVAIHTQRGATAPSGQNVISVHEFNLTADGSSLHISITPDQSGVPVRLYLRSQHKPTRDAFNLTTTLPLDDSQLYSIPLDNTTRITADPYQWFVSADSLRDGRQYFIGVEHVPLNKTDSTVAEAPSENQDNPQAPGYGDNNFVLNYTIRIFTSKCLFFDTTEQIWKSDGCEIGPLTTETTTHCLCNHLTAFGSDFQFFVASNSLNILAALRGFNDIASNPGVVVTIAVVVGVYLLFVIWARREDRKDASKIGATVLAGSQGHSHMYQLLVFTGARANASTSAKVSIILHGEYGTSGPHTLEDSTRITFIEGGVDTFVVTSHRPLGALMALHVWHDNLGYDPSWFLDKILITDTQLQNDSRAIFLCNRWFAVEEDDGRVDRILVAASEEELTRFSRLFSSNISKNIRDGHLWYSVVGRPATSTFTRVQRASCCLSLLLCSMVVNIMFFGRGGSFQRPAPVFVLGFALQFPINWEQVIIGIQSALIVFPVNLAIVQIFRYCRPRPNRTKIQPAPTDASKEQQALRLDGSVVMKDFSPPRPSSSQLYGSRRRSVFSDSGYDEGGTGPEPDVNADQEHQSLARGGSSRDSRSHSLSDARHDNGSSVFGSSLVRESKKKKKCLLPWWCVYFAWFLLFGTCTVSAFFTMLYGFEYGREKAEAWVFTFLTSFFFDLLITQPFKILLLAFFFALLIKKPDHSDEDLPPPTPVQEDEEYLGLYRMATNKWSSDSPGKVGPPDARQLQTAREKRFVQLGLRSALYDACFYFVYVVLLLIVANGNRDRLMFHLTQHQQNTFGESFSEVTDIESLWSFVRETVIPEAHAHQWYNDDVFSHQGFMQDSTSFVVGNVRLRQLRTKTNVSCGIPRSFAGILDDCDKSYDLWNADDVSHDVGWRVLAEEQNASEMIPELQPWRYHPASLTAASPFYGLFSAYFDGGYIVELSNNSAADLETVEKLEQRGWMEDSTRAVIIEIVVYNPNANLFTTVELLTEFSTIGKAFPQTQVTTVRLYQYATAWGYVMIAFQIAFLLVTMVFCFRELRNVLVLQKEYFKLFWKDVELVVCLLSLASIGVQLYTVYLVLEFNSAHRGRGAETRFMKYKEIGSWLQTDTYLLAWLVCVACLKLLHLLRFNKHVERGAAMAGAAARPLGHFFLVFFTTFSAFCMIAYLILGTTVEGFGTYVKVMETMVAVMMGEFDYYPIQDANWILGPAMFFFYLLICYNGMVFMFVTIFNEARREVSSSERHGEKSENRKIAELGERRLRRLVRKIQSKTRRTRDKVTELGRSDVDILSRSCSPDDHRHVTTMM